MSKRKPESETPPNDALPTPPAPKPARKHYPEGPVIIQQATPADGDTPAGWGDVPMEGVLSGKRDARKYAEDHAFAGHFRVVEILDEFECEVTSVPVVRFK